MANGTVFAVIRALGSGSTEVLLVKNFRYQLVSYIVGVRVLSFCNIYGVSIVPQCEVLHTDMKAISKKVFS
jgi:hypothetical protein